LVPDLETPSDLRPPFAAGWTLRACPGPELSGGGERLFGEGFAAGRDSDRTGVRLDGPLVSGGASGMPSVPVFPGTVQLPPDGRPIILLPDAGTTGGYPRVAQVIRADRHLLGQLRPGQPVRLLSWTEEAARQVLAEKTTLLRRWLGEGFSLS
jgi:allophanate hydrolase subunit 2